MFHCRTCEKICKGGNIQNWKYHLTPDKKTEHFNTQNAFRCHHIRKLYILKHSPVFDPPCEQKNHVNALALAVTWQLKLRQNENAQNTQVNLNLIEQFEQLQHGRAIATFLNVYALRGSANKV